MVAIRSISQNQCEEYINMDINLPDLDFAAAKQAAKERALEICSHPMILSWRNVRAPRLSHFGLISGHIYIVKRRQ